MKQGRGIRVCLYAREGVRGDEGIGEPCLGLLKVVLDFVVQRCFPGYRFEGVGDVFEQCFIAVYQCCHCCLVCLVKLVVLIEDDDADGEAEVLEVLAHAEEVTGEVVVGGEVVHFFLCLCGGCARVVDKAAAVADFGVEHLAGGKGLVGLNEVDDVVGHVVVGSPWDVLHLVGDDDGGDVVLLLEDFGGLGGEGGCFVDAGDGDNGCWRDK